MNKIHVVVALALVGLVSASELQQPAGRDPGPVKQQFVFNPENIVGQVEGPEGLYVFGDNNSTQIVFKVQPRRMEIVSNIDRESFEELNNLEAILPANSQ